MSPPACPPPAGFARGRENAEEDFFLICRPLARSYASLHLGEETTANQNHSAFGGADGGESGKKP